ncbi:MAG: LemA family protein [Flavobacteriales bacterium]|nr:LemA family protein [Bacteroidota bacterium]MCB9240314.1 LemA family protein [Flavobacteriales bacterium]
MSRGTIITLAVVGVIVLWGISAYNGLNSKNQEVEQKWGNVESQYQRRSDLIPNLAKTVKSYANFEQETLTQVIEARSKATQVTINPGELTAENMAKFQEAQGQLGGALSRLMAVIERYPDLKANQNYLDFQTELSGTENRINYARDQYNESVKVFNTRALRFPTVLVAKVLGFDAKPYYEADKGAENAPDVGDILD